MYKNLLSILIFCTSLLISFHGFAQCTIPCPNVFVIRDSTNCSTADITKPAGGPYSNGDRCIRACENSTVKYIIDAGPCFPDISYSLVSINGGVLQNLSGNTFTVNWAGSATGVLVLQFTTAQDTSGFPPCSDSIVINFCLTPAPVAAFTYNPNPVCNNNPTTINFNSNSSVNAISYFWKFGDGYTSTSANPSHIYTSPGTYTTTLIVSNYPTFNGQILCPVCVDSVQKTIVIDNLPGPDISCVAAVCAGSSQTYCTTANACGLYTWVVTGGIITSGQGTNCISVLWGNGNPQGSLKLVTTGCTSSYCTSGTTVNVPIIPASGNITGTAVVCKNTITSYSLPSWPGTSYSWTVTSPGAVINPYNTNTNEIDINWLSFGTYTISCTYYDTALACGGVANYTVKVLPPLVISGPTAVCQNTNSILNSTYVPSVPVASNWLISPATATITSGNGTSSINVNWPQPGVYNVSAIPVTPGQVCNSATYIVTVIPNPVITGVTGPDSVCAGIAYTYAAQGTGSGMYNWTFSNADSYSYEGANNDSVQVVWAATGPYSLSVYRKTDAGCISNILSRNIFPYPIPNLTGPLAVCADAQEIYTITNINSGNFNWSIIPSSFGTILSGQGTNSVQIQWHGNNSPGNTNTVQLLYGVCNNNSVNVVINEPPVATIISSGSLCGPSGITLSTGATGTFVWTGPGVPLPGNTASITGVTIPGTYQVVISNYNGTGCSATAIYNIPDVGRPVASISADNVLNYCLPDLPNMNLIAVDAPGYTFQWYNSSGIIPSATTSTLAINTLTAAGVYTYYCVVSLGGCVVTSNILVITISNCPGPGCTSTIDVTTTTGCNPFTFTIAAIAPAGATLSGTGNPTITHLEDNYTIAGLTTREYSSIGYKQVRICADVLLPDMSICRVCKEVTVLVKAAAKFTSVTNCNKISFTDASNTVSPTVITGYNWAVGYNPGNAPVPVAIGSFDNNTIANPTLTFSVTGSYIVTLTLTTSTCTTTYRDTFNIDVLNAEFNVANSCTTTPVVLNNLFPSSANFWDFGDAATAYSSPVSHSYAMAGIYTIKHIVTNSQGCKDTVTHPVTIVAPPVCTVTNSGPLNFCNKDSVVLGSSCTGLTNFQWFRNGNVVTGNNTSTDTAKQSGNYYFVAYDANGCKVISDTVSIYVFSSPITTITTNGNICLNQYFTASVPSCTGCSYQWWSDGIPVSTSNNIAATVGSPLATIGMHTLKVQVTNGNGCIDSSTIIVNFYNLPTVSISVSGPTPLCSNNAYVLTGTTSANLPLWSWKRNPPGQVLSLYSTLNTSSAGQYSVTVTDGVTGCQATSFKTIQRSPELNLFPNGCDTLCDTSHIFLPLASFNGNLSGYTINWYDNAPPYISPVGTGLTFPLNSLLPGNHQLSVIVTSPNGCTDTSNVYNVITSTCKVLPVKNFILSAKQTGQSAQVSWVTEEEYGNSYYEVERSLDGIHFYFVAKELSKGNSSGKLYYSVNDNISGITEKIWYRIKTFSKDGNSLLSKVVLLKVSDSFYSDLLIAPNPAHTNANLVFDSKTSGSGTLIANSADGKLIFTSKIQFYKGMNSIPVDCSAWSKGVYYISIKSASGNRIEKLVKQ